MTTEYTIDDLVLCESPDGWSLHAPGSTDEAIAHGDAPYILSGTGEVTETDRAKAWRLWLEQETYPAPAPIYADADYAADIIGYAATSIEATKRYLEYFGTDIEVQGARKIAPERRGEGPVDGWAPITDGY